MTTRSLSPFLAAAGLAIALAACRGAAPDEIAPLASENAWSLDAQAESIAAASCPEGKGEGFAMSFLADVEPVTLGDADAVSAALDGAAFAGGWALSAAPGSFGGLSGLKVMASGDLLAVSDAGALVEIGFDQEQLAPTGQVTLDFLRGPDGDILTGKTEADSEGLEIAGDIALVSFERSHRVMAFARGVCGSNARGVEVSSIGDSPASLGASIRGNGGAEGLVLQAGRLVIGLETVIDSLSPLAVIDADGAPQFAARPWIDAEGLPLVGLETSGGTLYSLHRAYNPLSGNSIAIIAHDGDGTARVLARLSRPLAVDNFEGIAVTQGPEGNDRIFIIADDNFSDSQRTLLFAFDRT